MVDSGEKTTKPLRLRMITFTVATAWTLLVVCLVAWGVSHHQEGTQEIARAEARAHFNRDQAFRFWGSMHGGTYVPISEQTPPNPYLAHIPERDIETPSGKQLTLMNPAYMVRQMNEEFAGIYGVPGRITSLKPLRPENAPDEWERAAMRRFESGAEEVSEFTQIDGAPHLRLMRPMITKKGCLKCHGHQGYAVGDVRGGVGVAVPLTHHLARESRERASLLVSFGLLWACGSCGIGLGSRHIREHMRKRAEVEEALRKNEAILAEAQRIAHLGFWDWGIATGELFWSDEIYRIFGLVPQAFGATYDAFIELVHPEDRARVQHAVNAAVRSEAEYDIDHRIVRPNGDVRYVHETGELYRDAHGAPSRMIGAVVDITDLKRAESEREVTLHALDQRVKELRCLQGVASAAQAHDTLDSMFRRVVDLIPPGWQFPEITHVRIRFDEQEYASDGFVESGWCQSAEISIRGECRGSLIVAYVEDRPEADEGPFLREERQLVDGIARTLSVATERRLTEEALRLSEERFARAVAGASDGLWDWDILTGEVWYAVRFEALLGLEPGELGSSLDAWSLRLHPDDVERTMEAVHLNHDRGIPYDTEYRLRAKDGKYRWFRSRGQSYRDEDGKATRMSGSIQDITERKRAETELQKANHALRRLASLDSLTGVLARRELFRRLHIEFDRARRYETKLACLMVDVDYFKPINDEHGHQCGDTVLRYVADSLRGVLRESDLIGRYGGEEFCIVLPHTDIVSATEVAERARARVESTPIWHGGQVLKATVSVGAAVMAESVVDAPNLVRLADEAMYEAKALGRNCVVTSGSRPIGVGVIASDSSKEGTDAGVPPEDRQSDVAREAADGLLHALAGKSKWTWEHSLRVGRLAADVGRRQGLAERDVETVRVAGELHDIGKLGVPREILEKPAALEAWERSVIDHHAELGATVIRNTGVLDREWLMVRWYHSCHESEGRREGEAEGEAMRLGAALIAAADAYDSLTSDRPYRRAVSPDEALAELRRCAGTQFDPQVVEALGEHVGAGKSVGATL